MGTQESNYRDSNQTKTLRLGRAKQKTATGALEGVRTRISLKPTQRDGERIRNLIQSNPGAARLYSVLSEHIDGNCGAVVADNS